MSHSDRENDLPEGWDETAFDHVLLSLECGSRPRGGVRGITEGIPSIGGEHLDEDGGFRFDAIRYVPVRFFDRMRRGRIRHGDILIVKDGATTGKVSLVRSDFPYDPAVVNEHVFLCRLARDIDSAFVFRYLFSKEGQERILANFQGSAQGGINQGFAPSTVVPVAPLPEQKRIVAKLEKLLSHVNAARDRLARIPAILKRFRQSVLSAACSGRLTEDWRSRRAHPDWDWVTLGELKAVIQTGPFGSMLHRSDYAPNGVPLVNPMHIRNGKICPSAEYAVSRAKAEELSRYRLREGDVVLGRRGEMGRSAVVTKDNVGFLCGTGSMFLRLHQAELDSDFVCLLLRSPNTVNALQHSSVGSTITNLNQGIVRSLPFPKVEPAEQHEIVHRVEALFALADANEKRVAAATERAEKLTQSILAKAFRGELVPTEAELARREGRTYEAASVLLDHIRAEREKQQAASKRLRTRRRK